MDVHEIQSSTPRPRAGASAVNRPPSRARVGQALGEWQAGELRYMSRHPHCRGLSHAQLEDLYQETVLALLNRPFFNEEHLRNALRFGLSKRALHVHRDERRRTEILTEHAPEAHRLALARSEIEGPEQSALTREDGQIVLEFTAELTPLERQLYALETEGLRYRAIAPIVHVEVNTARKASRSVASKRARFQLLHDTGRLCGYRAPTIRALIAGEATSEELALGAFAHLEACASCRAEHHTNSRRLRMSFQQRAAALLPVPALAGHLGWITRLELRLRVLAGRWLPGAAGPGGALRERALAAAAGSGVAGKLAVGAATVAVIAGGTLGAGHLQSSHHRARAHAGVAKIPTGRRPRADRSPRASRPRTSRSHRSLAHPSGPSQPGHSRVNLVASRSLGYPAGARQPRHATLPRQLYGYPNGANGLHTHPRPKTSTAAGRSAHESVGRPGRRAVINTMTNNDNSTTSAMSTPPGDRANSSTPAGGGFGGTLLAGNARGVSDLTFTASDPEGPGVYEITVEADGTTLYQGTPESNEGACAAEGISGSALMFDSAQPCRTSEAVELPLDTTRLPDGTHELKVTVTDAAQNSSVVYDGLISTQNAPVSTNAPAVAEAPVQAGETLSGDPGSWIAPAEAGAIAYAYRWQSCDPSGSSCSAIPGARSASYATSTTDVGHSLRMLVTATDSDGASTTASAPSAVVSAAPELPSSIAVQSTIGAANGTGASEDAELSIHGHSTITRNYQHRAFSVSGALVNSLGAPIVGAHLNVLAEPASAGTQSQLGTVTTAADGTFTLTVAAGPSRRIAIAYRAFAGAVGYSAQASITEIVTGQVRLAVTPQRTSPRGTITLSGSVAGPLPAHGVVVELLVHYRGTWEPFRDPRTRANGHFAVRYHFEGALGRFPFRAQVLGEQSGFPYATGVSRTIDVQSF